MRVRTKLPWKVAEPGSVDALTHNILKIKSWCYDQELHKGCMEKPGEE